MHAPCGRPPVAPSAAPTLRPMGRAAALLSLLSILPLAAACSPESGPNSRAPTAAPEAPTPVQLGQSSATRTAPPQRDDRLALLVHEGDQEGVLHDHGLRSLSDTAGSGFFTVAVEPGVDPQALLATLLADPRVACAIQESWAEGGAVAGDPSGDEAAAVADALRWHLDAARVPTTGPVDAADRVVVAVLDSGLVGQGDGGDLWAPSALSGAAIESPWDFVNGDPWPQDDQRHGSHMASIIAAAGAEGGAAGVAPGVSIMPLKVLNEDNLGSEVDIVNAIFWATDHGADIINLSLSFWPDYVPTEAMQNALGYADRHGVILVGAAGNHGLDTVSWPAASPLVIAVGATCMDGSGGLERAPYSNHGLGVDLVAPGGCLDRDRDEDGVSDGIVGEVPVLGAADARASERVLWGGTSQAAAVVSGALARLMQQGATGPEASAALRLGLSPVMAGAALDAHLQAGLGGGGLDLSLAASVLGAPSGDGVLVAVLPWLQAEGGDAVRPAARLSAVDRGTGLPLAGAELWVELVDTGGALQTVSCRTGVRGECDVFGAGTSAPGAQSWTFEVAAAIPRGGEAVRPGNVIFAHEGLSALERALDEAGETDAPLLALSWPAGDDPVLGPVADAWSFIDLTAGWARLPRAVVATRRAVEGIGAITAEQLHVGGDRLDEVIDVERLIVEGSGLSTSPIGLTQVPVLALRVGTALSGALAMHPTDAHTVSGSGLSTSPIGYAPIDLGRRSVLSTAVLDEALRDRYLAEGWRSQSGQGAGDVMPAVGLRDHAELAVEGSAAADLAPFPW